MEPLAFKLGYDPSLMELLPRNDLAQRSTCSAKREIRQADRNVDFEIISARPSTDLTSSVLESRVLGLYLELFL